MRRNIIETVMGAVVLAVAGVFVVFALSSSGVRAVQGYEVLVEFDDASGIAPGTEVRMSGVKIGTVISQELDPQSFFAQVLLSVDERIQLPTDTSARIVPDGLLGANYIALTPGGEEDSIAPGGAITYSQGAVNLMDLLGRFVFGGAEGEGEEGPS